MKLIFAARQSEKDIDAELIREHLVMNMLLTEQRPLQRDLMLPHGYPRMISAA